MFMASKSILRISEKQDLLSGPFAYSSGSEFAIEGIGLDATEITLTSTNFEVSYSNGKASCRLSRTFRNSESLRELARLLLQEADELDQIKSK